MKRFIKTFIFIFALMFAVNASAASYSITASKTSAYRGDSVTVTVTIYAGTWNLKVSGAATDTIVGYDMDGNVTTTKTYTIDTSSLGTKTVTLTGDITDYDTDVTTRGISKSVSITVSEAPATKPTTTTTTKKTTAPPTQAPKPTTKTTQQQGNQNNNTTTTTIATTEPTTEVTTTQVVNITNFKVVGYNIAFNKDTNEYDIKVARNVDELYIIVEGEEILVDNVGVINIKDKDSVDVIVKKGETTLTYKLNIIRDEEVKGAVEETKEVVPKGYIIGIVGLAIFSVIILFVLLYYLSTTRKGI